jgi:hypothetical protein
MENKKIALCSEYFLEHIETDLKVLGDEYKHVNITQYLSISFLEVVQNANKVRVLKHKYNFKINKAKSIQEYTLNVQKIINKYIKNPESKLVEGIQNLMKTKMAPRLAKVEEKVYNISKRTTKTSLKNSIVEPFLFINLRETKMYDHKDLLQRMKASPDNSNNKNLIFILENLVIYISN